MGDFGRCITWMDLYAAAQSSPSRQLVWEMLEADMRSSPLSTEGAALLRSLMEDDREA